MVSSKVRAGVVMVNDVPTDVRSWGRWVEDPPTSQHEDIVLIIPGNPGISTFYKEFAGVIHEKTGFTVWAIGYAGHSLPSNVPPFKEDKRIFGLKDQVEHKAKFVEKYVPKNARLHVVAHSIGSYITLKLLANPSTNPLIVGSYLLFPAIERMMQTRNGKFLCTYVKPVVPILVFLSGIFMFLPNLIQNVLITGYAFVTRTSDNCKEPIISLINPTVLKNIFYLAFEEMDQVQERDDSVIKGNVNKLKILYSATDGWAPKTYYEEIKRDIPDVDCHLSTYDHAFVLKESQQVGQLLAEWIRERQKLNGKQ